MGRSYLPVNFRINRKYSRRLVIGRSYLPANFRINRSPSTYVDQDCQSYPELPPAFGIVPIDSTS